MMTPSPPPSTQSVVCLLCYDEFPWPGTHDEHAHRSASSSSRDEAEATGNALEAIATASPAVLDAVGSDVRKYKDGHSLGHEEDIETGRTGGKINLDSGTDGQVSSNKFDHVDNDDEARLAACACTPLGLSEEPTKSPRRYPLSRPEFVLLEPCQHAFCVYCLSDYLRFSIRSGRVPVACPTRGNPGLECGHFITETLALQVLEATGRKSIGGESDDGDSERDAAKALGAIEDGTKDAEGSPVTAARSGNGTIAQEAYYCRKLSRLHRLHEDPSLRCCPHCEELFFLTSDNLGDRSPTICSSCHHALEDGSSQPRAEPLASHSRREAEGDDDPFRGSVPCSHCGMAIVKDSGCDHVVCPSCHLDMCYRCRTHRHLTGKVTRSCSKCQRSFVDHRYIRQYRLRILLSLPLLVPGWILYALATTLIAILTGCFCGCFLCGTMDPESKTSPPRVVGGASASSPSPASLSTVSLSPTLSKSGSEGPLHNGSSSSHSRDRKEGTRPPTLHPWQGIRTTVGYILLPVLVFLSDMGVECCGNWVSEMIQYE